MEILIKIISSLGAGRCLSFFTVLAPETQHMMDTQKLLVDERRGERK